jgi:CheY-like chemotaxis protein
MAPSLYAPARRKVDGAGRRLLLVEDEPAVRNSLALTLEANGYEVTTAANGVDARSLFDAGQFDVVVTDTVMPGGVSGIALVEALRSSQPTLPVILMTGYSDEALGGRLPHDVTLLRKPFAGPALLECIGALLDTEVAA